MAVTTCHRWNLDNEGDRDDNVIVDIGRLGEVHNLLVGELSHVHDDEKN